MTFQPGDVVFLKSGGQSMTVTAITDEDVECIWLGEEGDLFRQTIPAIALTSVEDVTDDEDDESEEDDDKDDEEEEEEEEDGDEEDDEDEEEEKEKVAKSA
jgi:uncharacterized protein YodC (DUF2158 family)